MKLKRLYQLLAAFFAIVAAVQTVRWSTYALDSKLFALNFLPLVAFALLVGTCTFRKWRDFHAPMFCVAVLAIAFWGVVTAFVEALALSLSAIVAVSKYPEMLAKYPDQSYVRHFPDAIPPDAKNVEFSYHPGFVGGPCIDLRYAATPEELDRVQRLIADTTNLTKMSKKPPHWDYDRSQQASLDFYEMGGEKEEYVGDTYGIGISEELKEVYYWACRGG